MRVRYLGSIYGSVRAPAGVVFDEVGAEGEVPDSWGDLMCGTDQFERAETVEVDDDESEGV